jgi:hypothetical protein
MFRLALTVLSVAVFAVGVLAQDAKSKQGAPKQSKDAWVVNLDLDKKVLTVLKPDGKQSELTFDDQTKFTTPQDVAMTTDRLKKLLLLPGVRVHLAMGDGTTIKELHMVVGGRRDIPRTAKKAPVKDTSSDPKNKEDKKDPGSK